MQCLVGDKYRRKVIMAGLLAHVSMCCNWYTLGVMKMLCNLSTHLYDFNVQTLHNLKLTHNNDWQIILIPQHPSRHGRLQND